jgi:hypothetical protein
MFENWVEDEGLKVRSTMKDWKNIEPRITFLLCGEEGSRYSTKIPQKLSASLKAKVDRGTFM